MSRIFDIIRVASRVPILREVGEVVDFSFKKARVIFNKVEKRFDCGECNGKGFIVCNRCYSGCECCNGDKFMLCVSCSGMGMKGFIYT